MIAYYTYDLSSLLLLTALVIAVISDLRRHRIPNWLTFWTLLGGLMLQFAFIGYDGLLSGLAGAGMGLVLLIPFYLLGGMGAGDVKMMAAVGTLLGYQSVMLAAAFSICLAGAYAIFLVTYKGEWTQLLQRYSVSLKTKSYVAPDANSVTNRRFPFALAIAGGTVAVLMMESQLEFYHLSTELTYRWQLWGAG
ncbi:prepilin peptidase [Pontibacterium sp.]|uniref:A24 family peptidase n=1 Tax=Pontibacterium sp. TaxID=2036026 RepID=UPI0035111B8A